MKKDLLFVLFLFVYGSVMAQTALESIDSRVLNSKQSISIKLPANYNKNSHSKHPLVLVLDGDYLLNPVIGQTDFQTYFENMPGSIIVGINYHSNKLLDKADNQNPGLLENSNAKFSKFIKEELLPYLDKTLKTSNFKVVVGYKQSVNLMNSLLLNEQLLFQAYVNLSPEFTEDMSEKIIKKIQFLNDDIIYYMASSVNDIESFRAYTLQVNEELKEINNNKFKFYFDDFDDMSHHIMVMSGVARGFEKVFDLHNSITDKETNNEVLSYEHTLD